jgi:putative copper export protein
VHRLGRSAARSGGRARRAYDLSHLRYYAKWNGPLLTLLLRLSLLFRGRP